MKCARLRSAIATFVMREGKRNGSTLPPRPNSGPNYSSLRVHKQLAWPAEWHGWKCGLKGPHTACRIDNLSWHYKTHPQVYKAAA